MPDLVYPNTSSRIHQDNTFSLTGMYPYGYSIEVYEVRSTDVFDSWLESLKDWKARARILARLDAAQLGNLGDVKVVGGGIREMRVHVGAGYRIYFVQRGKVLLLLLCGGDKSTQTRDIAKAQRLLADLD
jgi:putative addiction module killer protein